MIEPEMAFFDLDDDMDIQEDFVKYLLNWALTKCRSDLEFFDKRIQPGLIESLEKVAKAKFTRISYTQAIEDLERQPLTVLSLSSSLTGAATLQQSTSAILQKRFTTAL